MPASYCETSTAAPTNPPERMPDMPAFTFTLIVEGPDLQADATIDALFEAGCDDALVGRSEGVQYLDFDREAGCLEEAVLSAVADIESVDGLESGAHRGRRAGVDVRHRRQDRTDQRERETARRRPARPRRVPSASHRPPRPLPAVASRRG